jgi:alpha-D-xyloside xylohydrolase
LYEDDGTSEQYRKDASSRIPVHYDDATGTVSIGTRGGKGYPGMPAARIFRIRWIVPGQGLADDASDGATVTYTGKALTVRRPA